MALEYTAPPAPAPTPPLVISGTPYYLAMFNAAGNNVVDSNFFTTAAKEIAVMRAPLGAVCHFFTGKNNLDENSYSQFWTDGNAYLGIETDFYFFRIAETNNSNFAAIGVDKVSAVPFVILTDNINTSVAVIELDDNLQITTTNGKCVTFLQDSQDGAIQFAFGIDAANVYVYGSLNYIELTADASYSILQLYNASGDSGIDIRVEGDDTDTHIELKQATATIFRADAAGISTDGTNFLRLITDAAGAPTPDSKIEVIVNGSTYYIAAELVP